MLLTKLPARLFLLIPDTRQDRFLFSIKRPQSYRRQAIMSEQWQHIISSLPKSSREICCMQSSIHVTATGLQLTYRSTSLICLTEVSSCTLDKRNFLFQSLPRLLSQLAASICLLQSSALPRSRSLDVHQTECSNRLRYSHLQGMHCCTLGNDISTMHVCAAWTL